MKLYYSPGACSLSPHIALREAGLKFDLEQVDLGTKKTKSGADYSKVNPKGYVPALQLDSGQVLTEAAVLAQYIADQKPEANVMPRAGSPERYRAQEWLNYIATEVHKGFSPLFYDTTPDGYKQTVKDTLAKKFAYLDKQLAGKKYLMGDQFSVADGYLFTILGWAPLLKISLDAYPNVGAYLSRVAARPAVQAALKAEGLAA
ncbi:MAG: glutathione transferase GstA [Dongiaceae bacterium]